METLRNRRQPVFYRHLALVKDSLVVSFARTYRLVALAKLRRSAGVLVALIGLFGTWLLWLFLGHVPLYAVSKRARLESEQAPLPIQPAVEGVVIGCNLMLGLRVHNGDVLVRLDARSFELSYAEANASLRADLLAISDLQHEIDSQKRARSALADLGEKAARAGYAKVLVSKTTAQFKQKETAVVEHLENSELASKLDALHAHEASETDNAQLAATTAEAAQSKSSTKVDELTRDIEIAALEKSLDDTRSHVDVVQAKMNELTHDIDLRNIRAMATGSLADITPCSIGMTVTTQQKLATLLPETEIQVVSFFAPEVAVGRIMPGQHATLRIDNFPWTQFGTLGAVVDRVGSEPRDGLVRVELHVVGSNPAIPVAHGLSASTEVEVGRVAPFHALLRAAGQWVDLSKSTEPQAAAPP